MRARGLVLLVVSSLGLAIGSASIAAAKPAKGNLQGVVTGQGAGALGGVRVFLSKVPWQAPLPGRDSQTDYGGRFEFFRVVPGTYTVRVTFPGWQDKIVDGVEVQPGSTVKIAVEMAPAPPTILDPAVEPQMLNRSDWWGSRFGDVDIDALPTNRTVWSLLENQGIAAVTEPLDSAQLATGTPSLFGAHGASWTENQYLYNGFNVTDPYLTGQPLVDPDYAALSSVTELLGSKPSAFGTSGTNLIVEPRQPDPEFHGKAALYYSDRALESDNMNAALVADGFPGPQRMNSLYDGSAQLGGTLPLGGLSSAPSSAWSWPIFVALSTQQLSQDLGGFASPIASHADHILIELTPYRSGGRRLNLLYAGEQDYDDHDGAAIVVAPSATTIRNNNFHQFEARWSDVLGNSSVFEAGVGAVHAILSSGLENSGIGLSTMDLPDQTLTGSAPLAQSGLRTRYEANAEFQTTRQSFGSHALALGGDFDYSDMSNRWFALGGREQITVNGAPSEIIQWNTPSQDRQHVSDFSLFAQDAWRPAHWIEIPLGLRFTNSIGQADGAANRINWTNLDPRIGVILPTPHFRSVVWHAGWAIYDHALQGQYLDYGNPAALGGQIFSWNGSETGQLLRVFGGPYSGLASSLRRPFTDEVSVGVDARVGKFYQVRLRGWLRRDHYLIQSLDTGVPLSDYTPTLVNDPYVYDISTDGAYRTLTLYNETPSALGHDFDTLSNGPGDSSEAKGVDVEMTLYGGRNAELQGSFTAMQTAARTNTSNSVFSNDTGVLNLFGDDPNSMVNILGLTYFDRGKFGRLQAYYNFPWGIQASVVVRYLDGLPYSPLLFVNDFNQGPFFVLAVPRNDYVGFRAYFNANADLRVSKKFSLWRGTLAVDLDVFNLLNANHSTEEQDLADSTLLVRIPVAIQAPRTGRLGIDWNF